MTRLTLVVFTLLTSAAYPSGPAAKGVRFNCGTPGQPSASVHVGQLSTKPSKQAFIRVATLPTVAASGVEIRVKNPDANFLADFSEYIASLTKSQTFELQNVSIHVGDEKSPRITAQSITVSKQKWDLRQIRISPPHDVPRSFPSASINASLSPTKLALPNNPALLIQDILTTSPQSPR